MGCFKESLEFYRELIKSLRNDILRSPVELQLLWLFELLMIKAFVVFSKKKAKFITYDDQKLPYLKENHCYKAFDDKYTKAICLLRTYRDTFVHQGYISAIVKFDKVYECKEDLLELAEQVGAILNFNNKLF